MAAKRPAEDSTDSPRKRLRTNYRATFTILVGAEESCFTVHEDHLCRTSEYFKKACTGNWLESKDRTIRLAHVDAAIFQIYVEALYYPDIDLYEALALSSGDLAGQLLFGASEHRQVDIVLQLCGLWALGEYLQDYKIQNKVMDTLYTRVPYETFGSARLITWMSTNTIATSPLARYLRSTFAAHLKHLDDGPAILNELKDEGNKLGADVLMGLLEDVLMPRVGIPFCATYHVHPLGHRQVCSS
ncbi:hypothetical protein LTR56_011983 [Elasticomyces elasticus]|nr:hypothetical protein LTR22_018082 [Elasticomyces elasticus]KAK3640187.1 hypothetical protein LTR56_011983 [Elasticomyces elasticus]KAK4913296.1 hypothetical protein LTR49_018369 [Elasticomyces elasticus]KAK5749018.1 hypothetical protein LTS12_020916 [Elasticomyces elasticus]